MGLAERRVQQEYEKERIPKRLEQFKSEYLPTASFSVGFDWPSFEGQQAALDGLWSCWEQAIHGVEGVCKDDLGKEAIQASLKAIVVRNVRSNDEVKAEFKDGQLTVSMNFAEGSSGTPGWTEITRVLEAGL